MKTETRKEKKTKSKLLRFFTVHFSRKCWRIFPPFRSGRLIFLSWLFFFFFCNLYTRYLYIFVFHQVMGNVNEYFFRSHCSTNTKENYKYKRFRRKKWAVNFPRMCNIHWTTPSTSPPYLFFSLSSSCRIYLILCQGNL